MQGFKETKHRIRLVHVAPKQSGVCFYGHQKIRHGPSRPLICSVAALLDGYLTWSLLQFLTLKKFVHYLALPRALTIQNFVDGSVTTGYVAKFILLV